jgi:LmbE family N-acetylglucosaminyl deacetylase
MDMEDAVRLGFSTREEYAHARAAELDAALAVLGARPERLAYNLPDKQTVERAGEIVERLVRDLQSVTAILTHPYEGGHPDHDTAALAARLAVDQIGRSTGKTPALVEFASYHARDGARRFGCFWPDPTCPEQIRLLDASDRERTERAIAAHQTQADVIGGWRPRVERWRAAPNYDFAAPPPPGMSLYDEFGWSMTSARWRWLAQKALAA